jgi:hypothetical protein
MDDKTKAYLAVIGALIVGIGAGRVTMSSSNGEILVSTIVAVIGLIIYFSTFGVLRKLK